MSFAFEPRQKRVLIKYIYTKKRGNRSARKKLGRFLISKELV